MKGKKIKKIRFAPLFTYTQRLFGKGLSIKDLSQDKKKIFVFFTSTIMFFSLLPPDAFPVFLFLSRVES